jgi:hypothetical protein
MWRTLLRVLDEINKRIDETAKTLSTRNGGWFCDVFDVLRLLALEF